MVLSFAPFISIRLVGFVVEKLCVSGSRAERMRESLRESITEVHWVLMVDDKCISSVHAS